MLFDSTKTLLQSIVLALETGDGTRWDDQTESGNTCLYEMHQMSGALYKAYRSDGQNANSQAQSTLSGKLNRAMPHVRTMVIAIRRKDQITAIKSGKAALAEMNRTGQLIPLGCGEEPKTETRKASTMAPQYVKPTGRLCRVAQDRSSTIPGKRDYQ